MSKPVKPLLESKTTGTVAAGAASGVTTGGLAYVVARLICNALGIEPTPEVLVAIAALLTTATTPLWSRLLAWIRS